MKDIMPALRIYLLADATVSGLVGGQRVHYGRLPQDETRDSVVYTKVSEIGDYHMQGDSGLIQVRVQFDAWSQGAGSATALSDAVHTRLSGHAGALSDGGVGFVNIRGQFLVAGFDQYDPIAKLYRASRDYIIWYGASE